MIKNILVIKLNRFGDVLLTTPLLTTLKLNYPGASIDVLLYAGTEAMLAANGEVHHIHLIDRALKKQGVLAQLKGEKLLLQKLRKAKYDLVINLSHKLRAGIYSFLLRPALSIGFARHRHSRLYLWNFLHNVIYNNKLNFEQHEVLNNLSILKPLNLALQSTTVVMAYSSDDVARVKGLQAEHNFDDYILIQPVAYWGFKLWPVKNWIKLVDCLTDEGETVVLTGSQDEQEIRMIAEIVEGCQNKARVKNLAGQVKMTELAVLVKNARLFVGLDSVATHMAAALKTASVVLFGPTNIIQWHPWEVPHTLIWAGDYRDLPSFREIDTDTSERYLAAIPVEDVKKAVDHWIEKRSG
jgi:heptosyltransferase-3